MSKINFQYTSIFSQTWPKCPISLVSFTKISSFFKQIHDRVTKKKKKQEYKINVLLAEVNNNKTSINQLFP